VRAIKKVRLAQFGLSAVLAVLVGGGWYAYKFATSASLTGSLEFIQLANQGGLAANLMNKFSLMAFIRGSSAIAASWVWAGTWSLAKLPEWTLLPFGAFAVFAALGYLKQGVTLCAANSRWLPLWVSIPFLFGLAYHVKARIALTGKGMGTSGWYLHILAPAVAMALACGAGTKGIRWLRSSFVAYAALFVVAAGWAQAALFAGYAVKSGYDKHLHFPDAHFCLNQAGAVMQRLDVIAWPGLAVATFTGALLCLGVGYYLFRFTEKPLA